MPFSLDDAKMLTKELLTEQSSVELAVLFGSFAIGSEHAHSDLDLAILPSRASALSMTEELKLQDLLSKALGIEVDLVRLDQANLLLRRDVAKIGQVWFERHPGVFAHLAAATMLEYLDIEPLLEQGRRRYLARIATGLA